MPTLIKQFSNGSSLEFDRGRIDDWCIYISTPGKGRVAPTDEQYFARLQALGGIYTAQKIYDDFVEVYNRTTAELSEEVLALTGSLAAGYPQHVLEMDILLTILYAGMIAEENKAGAILKKKVKRLGMHQVLIQNMNPKEAAFFSRGMNWKKIDEHCKAAGF